MAKGEIVIIDVNCRGCGFCQLFCPKDCITITGDRFSPLGYLLPTFTNQDQCNACGICAWMCPHLAIDVYRYAGKGAAKS